MESLNELSAAEIAQRLRTARQFIQIDPGATASTCYREASVLIPFIRSEHEWHLLYIRRTVCNNDRHSGQVAFAGGKAEPFDKDSTVTALREANEEIGLVAEDAKLLGHLPHHYSYASGFRISPVIAQLPWPYPIKPDPREVERVFSIPVSWLANPAHYEIREREYKGMSMPIIYFQPYDGELLWGATARMTLSLLTALQAKDQAYFKGHDPRLVDKPTSLVM